MKEYKYKINGLKFTVSVGDVVDNEVTVEVNGTPYMVELDKAAHAKPSKPALSQSGKTASAQPTAAPTQSVKPAPVGFSCQKSASRNHTEFYCQGR